MKIWYAALVLVATAACGSPDSTPADMDASPDAAAGTMAATEYTAQLTALNGATVGTETTGEVRLSVMGDSLTIRVNVQNAPPNMSHWQHYHGFADGREATCPTADQDANGDGIIDLIETEPVSGTTMVPFNADPVKLEIPEESYPTATADGSYSYEKTVSMSALQAALGGAPLALEHRVVFIHGVPDTMTLPSSVASLGPVPAQKTIPIACGNLELVMP